MSAPRFYCPPPLPLSTNCELPPEAAHHASRVLRLRVGDAVQIFDGLGNALDATINAISGKHVMLGNLQTFLGQPESGLHIVLAQAMCTSDKMDWVVQKATELGAAEIVPVQTQRSVAKLTGARAEKRGEHWRNVTVSACEQSGRNTLPQLHAPQDLVTWLGEMRQAAGSKFILLPGGASNLQSQPKPQGRATLLIGPEGGFTVDEANVAQQAGFVPVLLGPRVLRTETAAIAGIAALQTLWGDFQ
ncbi:MAG: 16S rRNA (uracil(1498)-N(3))-methyltransferase [Sideroxyarcus sp.]|nr:16S rRNA (uracil(1498)-N(3))-methyltransferase [Sideroxyarcus sp.]